MRFLASAVAGPVARAFRTTVEVDAGQAVVATGPYRWVGHPSYGGLLLIAIGFGAVGELPRLADADETPDPGRLVSGAPGFESMLDASGRRV